MHILSPFPNRTLGAEISHKQTNESILRNILIASTVDNSKICCIPPNFLVILQPNSIIVLWQYGIKETVHTNIFVNYMGCILNPRICICLYAR